MRIRSRSRKSTGDLSTWWRHSTGLQRKKNARYAGRTERVLVDGPSREDSNTYSGRTDTFKLVNFRSPKDLTGEMADVKITEAKTFSLFGEAVLSR